MLASFHRRPAPSALLVRPGPRPCPAWQQRRRATRASHRRPAPSAFLIRPGRRPCPARWERRGRYQAPSADGGPRRNARPSAGDGARRPGRPSASDATPAQWAVVRKRREPRPYRPSAGDGSVGPTDPHQAMGSVGPIGLHQAMGSVGPTVPHRAMGSVGLTGLRRLAMGSARPHRGRRALAHRVAGQAAGPSVVTVRAARTSGTQTGVLASSETHARVPRTAVTDAARQRRPPVPG